MTILKKRIIQGFLVSLVIFIPLFLIVNQANVPIFFSKIYVGKTNQALIDLFNSSIKNPAVRNSFIKDIQTQENTQLDLRINKEYFYDMINNTYCYIPSERLADPQDQFNFFPRILFYCETRVDKQIIKMDLETKDLYTSLFSKYLINLKHLIVLKRDLLDLIRDREETYNTAISLLNKIQTYYDLIIYIRDGKQIIPNDIQSPILKKASSSNNFISPDNLIDYVNAILLITKTDEATFQAIDRHMEILKQATDEQRLEISCFNIINASILTTHHTVSDLLGDPNFNILNENNQSLIREIIGRIQKSVDYQYQSKILYKFGPTGIQVAYLIVLSLLVTILILSVILKTRKKKQ